MTCTWFLLAWWASMGMRTHPKKICLSKIGGGGQFAFQGSLLAISYFLIENPMVIFWGTPAVTRTQFTNLSFRLLWLFQCGGVIRGLWETPKCCYKKAKSINQMRADWQAGSSIYGCIEANMTIGANVVNWKHYYQKSSSYSGKCSLQNVLSSGIQPF